MKYCFFFKYISQVFRARISIGLCGIWRKAPILVLQRKGRNVVVHEALKTDDYTIDVNWEPVRMKVWLSAELNEAFAFFSAVPCDLHAFSLQCTVGCTYRVGALSRNFLRKPQLVNDSFMGREGPLQESSARPYCGTVEPTRYPTTYRTILIISSYGWVSTAVFSFQVFWVKVLIAHISHFHAWCMFRPPEPPRLKSDWNFHSFYLKAR
jgi:hypothetical protein